MSLGILISILIMLYGIDKMFEGMNEKVGCGCLSFIIVVIIAVAIIASHLI